MANGHRLFPTGVPSRGVWNAAFFFFFSRNKYIIKINIYIYTTVNIFINKRNLKLSVKII